MDKLKSLQTKKLLKELDFVETEYEYTSEVVSDADTSFMSSLNSILEKYPDLKDQYNKKLDETIEKNIKSKLEDIEGEEFNTDIIEEKEENIDDSIETDEVIDNKPQPSKKVKKLYREIVKLTHPDRVKDEELNQLYIEATGYYDNNDKIGIYKICNDLNINYDIDEEDELFISLKIQELRKKISFLESTFTWAWLKTEDDAEKEEIILNFIQLKIA